MIVETEKCIGCGRCALDCLVKILEVQDGKVSVNERLSRFCISCGHCEAICPVGAVHLSDDPEALEEYSPGAFDIQADQLIRFMKFRRSIRHFTSQPIEKSKISQLLEAGRYAPTGSNQQMVRYILLKDNKQAIAEKTLEILYNAGSRAKSDETLRPQMPYYKRWLRLYADYMERGTDNLFYDAPCVLFVVNSEKPGGAGTGALDAGLASDNIELMAHAMGLGVCYIGFFSMALSLDPSLGTAIGLGPDEELVATMALGHPAVKYCRTVRRKEVDVTML